MNNLYTCKELIPYIFHATLNAPKSCTMQVMSHLNAQKV